MHFRHGRSAAFSRKIHHQAFQGAIVAEPVEVVNYRELAALRTDFAIQKIFDRTGTALSPEKREILLSRKRQCASEMLQKNSPVVPNYREVIAELCRRGVLEVV